MFVTRLVTLLLMACPSGAEEASQCIAYEVPGFVSQAACRNAATLTAAALAHAQETSGADPSREPYHVAYVCVRSPETRDAALP